MSPETDDACDHGAGNTADSAGLPWEGRSFESNPHAADDGSADPALLDALLRFRAGEGSQAEVVDAFRSARVLIPLIAEKGEEGVAPSGLAVDKTQELSIVTVAAPDGRKVQPVFSSVTAMQAWDATARPIPVEAVRAALAASSEDTDLIVLDPTSETNGPSAGPQSGQSLRRSPGSRASYRRRCSRRFRRASRTSSPSSTWPSQPAIRTRACAGPSSS